MHYISVRAFLIKNELKSKISTALEKKKTNKQINFKYLCFILGKIYTTGKYFELPQAEKLFGRENGFRPKDT